ncbi:TBC1 domain family member 2B-like [Ptychodera flava]|uniref:TBC1 domain family member 2B-like n=1 Tax=Ptychodera flava TaxID=63121 RepID=UPI00396A7E88
MASAGTEERRSALEVPTATLISFDDVGDSEPKQETQIKTEEQRCKKEEEKPEEFSQTETSKPKLCGYLDKLGAKGLIKSYKTRWFIYDPRRCQLYYYRTPNDFVPLGSIEIANASFTFDQNDSEKKGQFEIVTKDRTYHLQAKDKHTMMFWLQELQERRREYSQLRTSQSKERNMASVLRPTSGLLHTSEPNEESSISETLTALPSVISQVDVPSGTVGEESAHTNCTNHSGILNWSITNWKTELRNQMTTFRTRTPSSSSSQNSRPTSTFYDLDDEEDFVMLEAEKNKQKSPKEGIASSIKKKFTLPRPGSDGELAQTQLQLTMLREEFEDVETELKASKEVMALLHNQLKATQLEKDSLGAYLKCDNDKEQALLIQRKDKQLIQLNQLLDEFRDERENLQDQLRSSNLEIEALKDQNNMLMEMIKAKDEIVIRLTNELSEVEENPANAGTWPKQRSSSTSSALKAMEDAKEIEKLKDAYQAFETQNKFLNKEILELNELRQNDMARERKLIEKHALAEAEFLRIQSKYFLLLKEMDAPRREGMSGPNDDMVSRLLQEALETDVTETVQRPPGRFSQDDDYDQYGFSRKLEGIDEDALVSRATDLQRRSEEISTKVVDLEMSTGVKWENYIVAQQKRPFTRSPELKALIRAGIPNEYREQIWKGCIYHLIQSVKDDKGPGYYQQLAESKLFKLHPSAKQIELDLLRTLPNNMHYENMDSDGIPKLRRVLLAYSCHNPDIGYCQGLNRVAAIALLFLSEEDAFWCLVAIVEHIMPKDYYSKTLIGSQTDQRVFKDILADKAPRLSAHLDHYNVDLSLITFNWFLTVFCETVPIETMLRIWDSLLYEGNKVLFRFSMAFFKYCEEEILKLSDYMAIFNYLRHMSMKMTDVRKIAQIAFHDLNPFPRKPINNRRAYHLQQVKAELAELNSIREEFVSQRTDRDEDIFSDEDN